MHGPSISDKSPWVSLVRITLIVVLFGWVILGQVLALVAAALFYDGNMLDALQNPLSHPDFSSTLLLSQGIAAFTGFIFMPWVYLKLSERRELGIFFKGEKKWGLLSAAILVAVVALAFAISPIAEWNANVQFPEWMSGFGNWAKETEEMAADMVKMITANMTPGIFVCVFLVVAVLPAIGEELVFRGLIQTEMVRALKNPHVAIWLTAIFFSAFHLQFLGFFPRMFIGAFLGYLYYWSGNLWIPIIGHFFNNGLQLIGLYLYQKGMISFDVESTDSAPWPVVIGSLAVGIALMFFIKNYYQSQSSEVSDVS